MIVLTSIPDFSIYMIILTYDYTRFWYISSEPLTTKTHSLLYCPTEILPLNLTDNLGHVSVSTRYTFLMLDLQYIVSFYLNQKYSYLKNIRLCANMLVKGLFTSDTEYEPGLSINEARKLGLMSTGYVPVPRDMAFHVPKGVNWDELYDLIKFPGKSKPIKKGIIHGNGVEFKDKPFSDENVRPKFDKKTSKVCKCSFPLIAKDNLQAHCENFHPITISESTRCELASWLLR